VSVLKNKMGLWLIIALVVLWVAFNAFSDQLFTQGRRTCLSNYGRPVCLEIEHDFTIRETGVRSAMWG
jgi:hypothetical protein